MPPKGKKQSPWFNCDKCSSFILFKDSKNHYPAECPGLTSNWITPFVLSRNIYTFLEINNDESKHLKKDIIENLIFIHPSIFHLCDLVIGDHVIIKTNKDSLPSIVRRVWPLNSPDSTNITAFANSKSLDPSWSVNKKIMVSIQPFSGQLKNANTIYLKCSDSCIDNSEFKEFLKISQENKIMSSLNTIQISFYGKFVTLHIEKIYDNESSEILKTDWFLINDNTKWIFSNNLDDKLSNSKEICIGGVDNILIDIQKLINNVYKSNANFENIKLIKCILLYGTPGVGKTLICKYIVKNCNVNVYNINASEIYSKYFGETEASLKKIFDEALKNTPSLIIIDDIETICSKKSSATSEQDQRVLSTMSVLLDKIHNSTEKIFILATTNNVDVLESTLRRYGRIDYEIEIPVPDKKKRLDIITKLFSKFSHNLTFEEITNISNITHGFVGADIVNLCTQALMHALNKTTGDSCIIEIDDFNWALQQVKPSAMKEVLIDVPDVKWGDIGGQDDLKLKLKQSIEWPLKHADSFIRLGIKPPSGLLMYGPPGCSKTMIAKALANESGLNFLSIKGPELFSKWVGESERAVRDVFRKARQVAPSIIFFDEIDALTGERSKSNNGSNVQERVLAQILTELDGVSPLGNVTVVAATNRPDKIDSALLRPGRLDRIVYVPLPDDATRYSIFQIKLSKMPIANDVKIEDLVNSTKNYSGAEIHAICNEAALKALEENIECEKILKRHFDLALKFIPPRTPLDLLTIYDEFNKSFSKT